MKNYVKKGEVLDWSNGTGAKVLSGAVVVLASGLTGVAVTDIEDGEIGAVNLTGCYELPKATGVIAQGAKVYFVTADKNVTTTASGNTLVGYAAEAAASADATVKVILSNSI